MDIFGISCVLEPKKVSPMTGSIKEPKFRWKISNLGSIPRSKIIDFILVLQWFQRFQQIAAGVPEVPVLEPQNQDFRSALGFQDGAGSICPRILRVSKEEFFFQ